MYMDEDLYTHIKNEDTNKYNTIKKSTKQFWATTALSSRIFTVVSQLIS